MRCQNLQVRIIDCLEQGKDVHTDVHIEEHLLHCEHCQRHVKIFNAGILSAGQMPADFADVLVNELFAHTEKSKSFALLWPLIIGIGIVSVGSLIWMQFFAA